MPLTGVQNIATNQRMNEWQRRAKPLSVTTAQTDGIGAPQPPQKTSISCRRRTRATAVPRALCCTQVDAHCVKLTKVISRTS